MSKSTRHYREKGYQDGKEGNFDKPHGGAFRDMLGSSYSDKEKDDREAYRQSYKRGKKNR